MTKSRKEVVKSVNDDIYQSRRGNYQLMELIENPIVWTPEPLGETTRDTNVILEVSCAIHGMLDRHPYWKDEPNEFIEDYTKLYCELFGLSWLGKRSDRHNVVVNANCCLTLVQYNNGVLSAYSRSTDMRNGYYSDKKILDYLAQCIYEKRPDCHVDTIKWYLACPHIYVETGIARLKEVENE